MTRPFLPTVKAYTGIGSRETPSAILQVMETIGHELAAQGWTLRSGCAPGADSAFERGAFDAQLLHPHAARPELYLPWPGFENRRRALVRLERPDPGCYPVAATFHPAWERLSDGAKALHARNVHQVFGPDPTHRPFIPSRFVICWTPEGKGGGGTGQALRIAKHYNIPIFDLAREADYDRVTGGLFA